jgi:hypothetical protein
MANTRNRAANNNVENNGENNNNDANLRPPSSPSPEQVLAMQAQMLQTMVNLHAQPQAARLLPWDRLGDFQCTKPLSFSHADDWLKSVEKKLQVVQCNNRERVLLASHQLFGRVADLWDAYVESHEEPESINWP